jgi:hypothetical protein
MIRNLIIDRATNDAFSHAPRLLTSRCLVMHSANIRPVEQGLLQQTCIRGLRLKRLVSIGVLPAVSIHDRSGLHLRVQEQP